MPKPKEDRETSRILSEQEKIAEGVKAEFWQIAKSKLYRLMGEINSIVNIPAETFNKPVELNNEIARRYNAIALVQSWIKEVEGIANKHEFDKKALERATEEEILIEFN